MDQSSRGASPRFSGAERHFLTETESFRVAGAGSWGLRKEELVERNAPVGLREPSNPKAAEENGAWIQVAGAQVLGFRTQDAIFLRSGSSRSSPARSPGSAMGRTRRDQRIRNASGARRMNGARIFVLGGRAWGWGGGQALSSAVSRYPPRPPGLTRTHHRYIG